LGNREGVIDRTGKWVIEPKYATISGFHEGFAVFQAVHGGKFGVIDSAGRVVLEPKYRGVDPFVDGVAEVRGDTESDSGYVDKQLKFIWKGRIMSQ